MICFCRQSSSSSRHSTALPWHSDTKRAVIVMKINYVTADWTRYYHYYIRLAALPSSLSLTTALWRSVDDLQTTAAAIRIVVGSCLCALSHLPCPNIRPKQSKHSHDCWPGSGKKINRAQRWKPFIRVFFSFIHSFIHPSIPNVTSKACFIWTSTTDDEWHGGRPCSASSSCARYKLHAALYAQLFFNS